MVPTGQAGGQQRDGEDPARRAAQQRFERVVGFLDGGHVREAPLEERRGGHDEHGRVDQPRKAHGDGDVDQLKPEQSPRPLRVARQDAVLGERRVQKNHMRHDRRAQDGRGEQHGLLWQNGHHGVKGHLAPIRRAKPRFQEIGNGDDAYEHADDGLDLAEAAHFESQNEKRREGRCECCREEGHAEEEVEADRRADVLGEVCGHGDDFHHSPHAPHHGLGEVGAAMLGEIRAGGDSQLGRESLHQQGHQVARHHHPDQRVAELGTGLDVRGEVAGVDIGHAGDEGGPQEGEEAADAPFAALPLQHVEGGLDGSGVAGLDAVGGGRALWIALIRQEKEGAKS